jgi:hypothetical protein
MAAAATAAYFSVGTTANGTSTGVGATGRGTVTGCSFVTDAVFTNGIVFGMTSSLSTGFRDATIVDLGGVSLSFSFFAGYDY